MIHRFSKMNPPECHRRPFNFRIYDHYLLGELTKTDHVSVGTISKPINYLEHTIVSLHYMAIYLIDMKIYLFLEGVA